MYVRIISLLWLFGLLMGGCEPPKPPDEDTPLEHQTEISIHNVTQGDVEILEIDGCQYIIYKETDGPNRAFGYMAHKGNCNNPVHLYQPRRPEPEADSVDSLDPN